MKLCPWGDRFNLTSFAMKLNELTPGLAEKIAPTDCRLRPDQRATEEGYYDKVLLPSSQSFLCSLTPLCCSSQVDASRLCSLFWPVLTVGSV